MTKIIKVSDKMFDALRDKVELVEDIADNIVEKTEKFLEIKNRFTGSVIWKSKKTTIREAVKEAVASGANLSGADLSEADLSEANLSEANLSKANLSGADLSGADLSEANLSGADLSKANLSEANLSKANLSEANLRACLFYMGDGNRNFEALCKAIRTIKHPDGKFEDFDKK